jgi:hypothetical protein
MISPVAIASIAKPWIPENLPAGTVRNDWNPLASYVTLNAGKLVTLVDTMGADDMSDFGVAGGRPIYTAVGQGGYPQIEFDGAAQTIGTAPSAFLLAQPFTVLLVYQQTPTVNGQTLYSDGGGTAFQQNPTTPSVNLFATGGNWALAGDPVNQAGFGVELIEHNGVNSKLYNNGTLLGTSNPTDCNAAIDSLNLAAYQYQPFSSNFLACKISRAMLINGLLSTANRNLLTNYMRARYGLP